MLEVGCRDNAKKREKAENRENAGVFMRRDLDTVGKKE